MNRPDLEAILARAREEAARLSREDPAALRARRAPDDPPRGFAAAIRRERAAGRIAVIAEAKRRAPSSGDFPGVDPRAAARAYARGGATALSILADPHFGMDPEEFPAVRAETSLPALWKGFVLSRAQVDYAYGLGADAVLLLARCHTAEALAALYERAKGLGLDVLVEIHDADEIAKIPEGCDLVGANARDLGDPGYRTAPARLSALRPLLPEGPLLVAESGFHDAADVRSAFAAGPYDALLVGTSLLRDLAAGRDPADRIAALRKAAGSADG
ncbi:MAG: indole-3-glycerol phosphate synthase 2 [Actinomycetota bacterium]|nr:MAG: indole-3-glycerol phosphate synthase 2 [Actinomycetota bacterium]